MKRTGSGLAWLCCMMAATAAAQTATISGRVIDARTRLPLAGAIVLIEQPSQVVETDARGAFTVAVPPGSHSLIVSLIGYATVRQPIVADSITTSEMVIELSEGAGPYEETVTVAGARAPEADRAPGGSIVHGRDLQALRGVMLDDPLRAVQSLPSATSTDDFYSEFSVRGSPFRHLGLAIDGIPAPYLIHSIHSVTDGGSITMVNSEALNSAALLPGSYPQHIGRRLGAQIDLTTRDGNRDGVRGRVGLSGTSANAMFEGPLAAGRGAWVASVRRSYLDFLLDRIDPDGSFGFGFSDALAKVTFDVTPRHQLQALAVVGRSVFDESPEDIGVNDEAFANSRAWLAAATWRYTPSSRLAATQRVFVTGMDFRNVDEQDVLLDRGGAGDFGWRTDVSFAATESILASFGAEATRSSARATRQRTLDGAIEPVVLADFSARAHAMSVYGQLAARFGAVTITPGARVDRWNATATTATSPWINAEWRMTSRTQLRAGTGVHRQFPALTALHGLNANPDLRPERADHRDVSVVQQLPRTLSLQLTAFQRDERDVLTLPGAEPRRTTDGAIVPGRGDAKWSNRLSGRARGIEAMLRRDAPDGVSGWIAYGYGEHRYRDVVSSEQYWSDFDQRHSLSAYALYRVSSRTTVGAKFRYGSNYPITGYVGEQAMSPDGPPLFGGERPVFYGLADTRNTLRLPPYARLDIRADRASRLAGRQVTWFVEVANALNRRNVRNVPYSVGRNGQLDGVTDSLLPIVPSAGFVIEF